MTIKDDVLGSEEEKKSLTGDKVNFSREGPEINLKENDASKEKLNLSASQEQTNLFQEKLTLPEGKVKLSEEELCEKLLGTNGKCKDEECKDEKCKDEKCKDGKCKDDKFKQEKCKDEKFKQETCKEEKCKEEKCKGDKCKDSEESVFDKIIEAVGNDGYFQKRFNIIFNFVLVFLATMPYLNFIIALAIPDHWCTVPGRELTNFTVEEWKSYTIPKEIDTRGLSSYKKCRMYNVSHAQWERFPFANLSGAEEIACQYGHTYDTTWYRSTAPSDQNWVCEKDTYVANAFAFGRLGDVIGTFTFGQLGDIIGRKPVFYTTLVISIVGRLMSAFTPSNYAWFLVASVIGSMASTSIFQAPLVVAMEISKSENRAHIAMMQAVSWTMSISLMPFIMWAVQDWLPFMLLTTLPCAIFLFSNRLMIESPRWLVSSGKVSRALGELEKIAKINGTYVPDDAALLLRKSPESQEKLYGVMSLFSSWRLAKNTILLVTGWVITATIYYTLTLNVNNLGGNPFLNYFWQGLAEMPAYILGKYASDVIGRRWTHILAFLVTAVGCIPLVYTVVMPGYEVATSALAVFIKFSASFAWYAVNLQALETYPTCVRQTGTSLGAIMANAFGVLSPYIVYWGTSVNPSMPYLIASMLCVGGAICGLFLPETLNKKLPETLADAQQFGADQPFWNFPWNQK